MFRASIEEFLEAREEELAGQVQLVFFSPPFPLNRKKSTGTWQATSTSVGSVNSRPLQALMRIAESGGSNVCQQFVCHNPARLPSPAPWVTIQRIRVKDSYTHVWWMSPTGRPRATNSRVLRKYSKAMEDLHQRGSYNKFLVIVFEIDDREIFTIFRTGTHAHKILRSWLALQKD